MVAVRTNTTQQKLIGYLMDFYQQLYLAILTGDWSNSVQISDTNPGYTFPTSTNVDIDLQVQNDTYTLSVNHRPLQVVTLTGYPSGGIIIGSNCQNKACPSFDNIKVTYLP